MMARVLFLAAAAGGGFLLSFAGVPAGWLVGGILAGILLQWVSRGKRIGNDWFNFFKTFIGLNIGVMFNAGVFLRSGELILPFLVVLILTFLGGGALGFLMYRYSRLDPMTAFFCCIPGGASEVIAVSRDYGADQRVVAAFHSARIVSIVLITPAFLTLVSGLEIRRGANVPFQEFAALDALILLLCGAAAYALNRRFKIPAGTLIYSIALGIAAHWAFIDSAATSRVMSAFAQSFIGCVIGMQFDRDTMRQIRHMGPIGLMILGLYFLMGVGITVVFDQMTSGGYVTSYLSVIPAGAVEMAAIASSLGLEATTVATMQISRLLIIFLVMPKLILLLLRFLQGRQ